MSIPPGLSELQRNFIYLAADQYIDEILEHLLGEPPTEEEKEEVEALSTRLIELVSIFTVITGSRREEGASRNDS